MPKKKGSYRSESDASHEIVTKLKIFVFPKLWSYSCASKLAKSHDYGAGNFCEQAFPSKILCLK